MCLEPCTQNGLKPNGLVLISELLVYQTWGFPGRITPKSPLILHLQLHHNKSSHLSSTKLCFQSSENNWHLEWSTQDMVKNPVYSTDCIRMENTLSCTSFAIWAWGCWILGARTHSDTLSTADVERPLAAPVYAFSVSRRLPQSLGHWRICHILSFEQVTYIVYVKIFSILSVPCAKQYPVLLYRIRIVPALTQCQSESNRKHWHWQGVPNQLKPSASCFQVTHPSISVQAAWSLMA